MVPGGQVTHLSEQTNPQGVVCGFSRTVYDLLPCGLHHDENDYMIHILVIIWLQDANDAFRHGILHLLEVTWSPTPFTSDSLPLAEALPRPHRPLCNYGTPQRVQ